MKFFTGEVSEGVKSFKQFLEEKRKIVVKQGEKRQKIIVACKSLGVLEAMKRLFEEAEIGFIALKSLADLKEVSLKYIGLCIYELNEGFENPDLLVIADEMVIGKQITSAKKKKALNTQKLKISLNQLNLHGFNVIVLVQVNIWQPHRIHIDFLS